MQAIFGSPFYGILQPGAASLANTTAESIVCAPNMALVPPLLPQGTALLQACFLISTFDEFGNAITATPSPLNITLQELQPGASACVLEVKQLQALDGECQPHCPLMNAQQNGNIPLTTRRVLGSSGNVHAWRLHESHVCEPRRGIMVPQGVGT